MAARSTDWIQVVQTPPIPEFLRSRRLGPGETSVLTLALAETGTATSGGDVVEVEVILDDGKARRRAEGLGVRVQGTLALLLIAKTTRRIAAVRPLLEQLHAMGMRVSDEVMRRVITKAGE